MVILNFDMAAVACIELHLLPSLEYFCALQPFHQVVVEKHEHFVKQSYRNRYYILTAQGTFPLTVPIIHSSQKQSIDKTAIDYSQKWQNNHWRTIESAYRNAPFFEFYEQDLRMILYRRHDSLFQLNYESLSFCLRALGLSVSLSETVTYEPSVESNTVDLRDEITAKKSYLDRTFYRPLPYYQVFGSAFVANLSAIDLLFCMGPQSLQIIRASAQTKVNN